LAKLGAKLNNNPLSLPYGCLFNKSRKTNQITASAPASPEAGNNGLASTAAMSGGAVRA
jgi:hypothetical protein